MLLPLVDELAPERLPAEDAPLVAGLEPGLVELAKKALMLPISSLNGLLDELPLQLNELPLKLNQLPLELNELPLELNQLPLELNELPLEVKELPLELNGLLLELNELLLEPLDELLPKRSLKNSLTGLLLEELLPKNELLLPENEGLPEVDELGTGIRASNPSQGKGSL